MPGQTAELLRLLPAPPKRILRACTDANAKVDLGAAARLRLRCRFGWSTKSVSEAAARVLRGTRGRGGRR